MKLEGTPTDIPAYFLEFLESSSVVIGSWSGQGNGTEPPPVDWWLMLSILEILEELFTIYNETGEFQIKQLFLAEFCRGSQER